MKNLPIIRIFASIILLIIISLTVLMIRAAIIGNATAAISYLAYGSVLSVISYFLLNFQKSSDDKNSPKQDDDKDNDK